MSAQVRSPRAETGTAMASEHASPHKRQDAEPYANGHAQPHTHRAQPHEGPSSPRRNPPAAARVSKSAGSSSVLRVFSRGQTVKRREGSAALLLRFFQSSHFNVHFAVEYLQKYSQSIGITHYLVDWLRGADIAEVEIYWPQLCCLLVTTDTPSVALENFILEACEREGHLAVTTLWYFQATLHDVALAPGTPRFVVARRVYMRVQYIIFSDPRIPSADEQDSGSQTWFKRPRDRVHVPSTVFVGAGLIGAAVAAPWARARFAPMVIAQGQRNPEELQSFGTHDADDDDDVDTEIRTNLERGEREKHPGERSDNPEKGEIPDNNSNITPKDKDSSSDHESTPPTSPLHELTLLDESAAPEERPSEPKLALPGDGSPVMPKLVHTRSLPNYSKSMSHLATPREHESNPYSPSSDAKSRHMSQQLIPSYPSTRDAPISAGLALAISPGHGLPRSFLSELLRRQASRAQLDLVRALQDISTRLVSVPKPARLSSLRAELTVLNHLLPCGCCLGMACDGTQGNPNSRTHTDPVPHSRVVRISPSEAVVLNSADRAPYVVYVEVLERDLDFDPLRRQNSDDLRRALKDAQFEDASYSHSADMSNTLDAYESRNRSTSLNVASSAQAPFSPGTTPVDPSADFVTARKSVDRPSTLDSRKSLDLKKVSESKKSPRKPDAPETPTDALNDPFLNRKSSLSTNYADLAALEPPSSSSQFPLEEEEPDVEVDIVEQLFGPASLRSNPDDFVVTDPKIENRGADELAWMDKNGHSLNVFPPSAPGSSSSDSAFRPSMSLDDYAERMRMAAIMLSQLNVPPDTKSSVPSPRDIVTLPITAVAGIGGAALGGVATVAGLGVAGLGSIVAAARSNPTRSASVQAAAAATSTAAAGSRNARAADATAAPDPADNPPSTDPSAPRTSISNIGSTPQANVTRNRILSSVEANLIRERIMSEMLALEEERMSRMRTSFSAPWLKRAAPKIATTTTPQETSIVLNTLSKEDPSGAVFQESFAAKASRIRKSSPFGHLANWNIISVIVKTGADLRQEQLAVQLIREFGRIWKEEACPLWVRYYRILVTSESTGLMETITDSVSVHSLKKDAYARAQAANPGQPFKQYTLYDYFIEKYGPPGSPAFYRAQDAFCKSLAAYSIVCYILELKDRHNGNILIDKDGHCIHIDFGFLLSNTPGSIGFEKAPFKLTQDYIDILGGFNSEKFLEFKALLKRGFRDVRKHADRIITLVQLMQKDSNLPCFQGGERTVQNLRDRFVLSLTQSQVDEYVERLLLSAALSTFTRLYDVFQYHSNGIL